MNNDIKEILDYLKSPNKDMFNADLPKSLTQKECNILLDYITNLQEIEKEHKNCTRKHWQEKCAEHCANETIYKSRIEKAIELLKEAGCYDEVTKAFCDDVWEELPKLLNILQGDDKEC